MEYPQIERIVRPHGKLVRVSLLMSQKRKVHTRIVEKHLGAGSTIFDHKPEILDTANNMMTSY